MENTEILRNNTSLRTESFSSQMVICKLNETLEMIASSRKQHNRNPYSKILAYADFLFVSGLKNTGEVVGIFRFALAELYVAEDPRCRHSPEQDQILPSLAAYHC